MEFVMKYILTKKTLGQNCGFNSEFHQLLRKKKIKPLQTLSEI